MSEKERLVEYLERHYDVRHELTQAMLENLADYLLERFTFPPCKVGDIIHQVGTDGKIYSSKIKKVIYETDSVSFDETAIDNGVFLSYEKALRKLGELNNSRK